ncbi:MAG: helix-turn-helix transcriptional regulator [Verrucomicrobiota bacterium]
MVTTRLPNYLRSHRKRLAFSQEDVAFLLGAGSGAKVCRYERFVRVPSLETALAFEVIFRKPVRELFAGQYEKVECRVLARAQKLLETVDEGEPNRIAIQKRKAIIDLAAAGDGELNNLS